MGPFDVIFVQPYPFADHPSFPEGILKRALEQDGFSVGVIERPRWQEKSDFTVMGRPRLFFAVIAGPLDSLVANYTSARKRRREDLYQEGGRAFFPGAPRSVSFRIRPDRTLIVFANRLREAFPGAPIVIGGIEATMRRFSHYDFLDNALRRPILVDARADILVTGMGEKQLVAVARLLAAGNDPGGISISGITRVLPAIPASQRYVELPAHEEMARDAGRMLEAQRLIGRAVRQGLGIVQQVQNRRVVQAPFQAYEVADLDYAYGLPYTRLLAGGGK